MVGDEGVVAVLGCVPDRSPTAIERTQDTLYGGFWIPDLQTDAIPRHGASGRREHFNRAKQVSDDGGGVGAGDTGHGGILVHPRDEMRNRQTVGLQ
jgi:hypothetical protein